MLDLITGAAWALEAKYYLLARETMMSRISAGLPALDAEHVRPRRYSNVNTEGRPAMWMLGGVIEPQALVAGLSAALGSRSAGGSKGTQVAVVPVQGPMTKRGGMCTYGTKDAVAMLASANADDRVGAIVLDIDSPGGQVDGTEEFANAVRTSAKPVVAYIDGLGASAAYWVASQARSIYVNSASTGFVGSIGVLCTYVDQSAMLEKQGAKVKILRAAQSTDKARPNSLEPLTKELQAEVEAELTAVCDTFISAVRAGRGDRLTASDEQVFTGRVWTGAKALEHGLVDAVGSLQQAAAYALSLVE